jgi:hypothetical protein
MQSKALASGLATALLLACGDAPRSVSPQPLPVPDALPGIDATGISLVVVDSGHVSIRGEKGTIQLAHVEVWAADLDTQAPAVSAPVLPDGSFAVVAPGSASDVYRLEGRAGPNRTGPIDLSLRGGMLTQLPALRCGAWLFPNALNLTSSSPANPGATVRFPASCIRAVTSVRWRVGTSSFSVQHAALPLQPSPTQDAWLVLQQTADAAPDDADDLLVEVDTPTGGMRLAVSVEAL